MTVVKKHSDEEAQPFTPNASRELQLPKTGKHEIEGLQGIAGPVTFLGIFNSINLRLMAKMVAYTHTRFNILALTLMKKELVLKLFNPLLNATQAWLKLVKISLGNYS